LFKVGRGDSICVPLIKEKHGVTPCPGEDLPFVAFEVDEGKVGEEGAADGSSGGCGGDEGAIVDKFAWEDMIGKYGGEEAGVVVHLGDGGDGDWKDVAHIVRFGV